MSSVLECALEVQCFCTTPTINIKHFRIVVAYIMTVGRGGGDRVRVARGRAHSAGYDSDGSDDEIKIIEEYQATPTRTNEMLDSSRPVLFQVLYILSQVGW